MLDWAKTVESTDESQDDGSPEVYHFCVVCPTAQQVCLLGEFNNWSTNATPMTQTEEHVWQLSVQFPKRFVDGPFAYFVIDKEFRTGRAAFGSTYLLPGSWAAVVRENESSHQLKSVGR